MLKCASRSLAVMRGGSPNAAIAPVLTDGSRKNTGISCPCRSARCSSVTLPKESNFSSSDSVMRCCAAARARGPSPCAAAIAAAATPICRISRRLDMEFAPQNIAKRRPTSADLARLASLRGQMEFEITIFFGVRRQVVGPDRHLTPLEALANVPDRLLAGAPGWKMVELSAQFAKPLATNPLLRAFFAAVAVGAGKVQCADLARAQLIATLVGGFCRCTHRIDGHWRAVGEIPKIGRKRCVLLALHEPVMSGRGFRMARDELLNSQHLGEARLPFRHGGGPTLEWAGGTRGAGGP